jgi:hypothetical protein
MHRRSNEDVQPSQAGRGSKAIRSIEVTRFRAPLGNAAAIWPVMALAQQGVRIGRRRGAAKKTALALAVAGMVLVTATAATAFQVSKSNRIRIAYVLPKNPAHQHIYERLKEDRALEKLQKFLSPFRLPRTLTVSLKGCDGEADAWYDKDEITICYEYINELWKNMPAKTTPLGIEPMDTVIGPLCDTALHEFAHALFDMLNLPVLGREEDAADQVAVYINLQFGKGLARRLIMGTAYAYANEAHNAAPLTLEQFSDEHGTPAQRAYNEVCIAYGADPKVFGDMVSKGYLPKKRAEACGDEYEQIAAAYKTLIMPHIDRAQAMGVLYPWVPETTKPLP